MLTSHNASNNAKAVVYLPAVSVSKQVVIVAEAHSEDSCRALDIAAEAIEAEDVNVCRAANGGDGCACE